VGEGFIGIEKQHSAFSHESWVVVMIKSKPGIAEGAEEARRSQREA
jgi:hypothetical protein